MKNTIFDSFQFRNFGIRCLVFLPSLMIFQLFGCKTVRPEGTQTGKIAAPSVMERPITFQEIGFFGEIKKDQWDEFVLAVQHNISHSRKEQGNLAFRLYQPEDGRLQPVWFERFKCKAAHNYHKQQRYFKDAIKTIQGAVKGEVKSITLSEIKELPVETAPIPNRRERTLYSVALYHIRPGKKKFFIDAVVKAALQARKAPDNLEYNLYEYADDPNRFVLIEGWQSKGFYNTQSNEDYMKKLDHALNDFLITSSLELRWTLKDISK